MVRFFLKISTWTVTVYPFNSTPTFSRPRPPAMYARIVKGERKENRKKRKKRYIYVRRILVQNFVKHRN